MSLPPPPIIPDPAPSESDLALVKLWHDLEKEQLTILDQANKRIIEMVTGLQALFLAVVAFGKDFPHPYLQTGPAPYLAVAVIFFLILALIAAAVGLQPREYRKFENNLSGMRGELTRMVDDKKRWYQFAMRLFVVGSVLLAALVILIILQNM